jgi:hypothetical protein
MTADYGLNAGSKQPVKEFVDLRSGNAEDVFSASRFQRFHNYVGSSHNSLRFACLHSHNSAIHNLIVVSHLLDPFSLFIRPFEEPRPDRY